MSFMIYGISGFVVGIVSYAVVEWLVATSRLKQADEKAATLIEKAELEVKNLKSEATLELKREQEEERKTFEKELKERERNLEGVESRLSQKENKLDMRIEEMERREKDLVSEKESLAEREKELARLVDQQKGELERLSSLTQEEAKNQLLSKVQSDMEYEVALKLKEFEALYRENSKKKAMKVISEAIQRCSVDYASEALVSVVNLPNDEMKGRIIGRDGRNIRAFESLTGIDVIVDDTPEAIVLSGFNSIKREVARMTMEKLILDGRIHPAKIEQSFEQSQKELYENIRETGEQSVLQAGVQGLHDKLVIEVGKLRYRTSYGQNLLKHSLEVSRLATIMANEIGANANLVKRAGLLHDIGKVADSDDEGSHAILGMQMAKKYGERAEVCNAIGAHHEEVDLLYVESVLVQVADTLSASRPGARRETLEGYIKRLEELENIAKDFSGVSHAYAIQAGREIRVLVKPSEVDDALTAKLSHDIVKKIETDLEYPGQVKVVVIRETRAVDIAK